MKRFSISLLSLLLMMSSGLPLSAQVINMHVNLKDGTVTKFDTDAIESVTFEDAEQDGGTENQPTEPTVTGDADDITDHSATLTAWANGIQQNLSTDLRVGILYATDPTPTQSNAQQKTVSTSQIDQDGKYTLTLTGLSPSTTYYYRSFVYQSGIYRYGAIKSFTTLGPMESVTTGTATSITCFSAQASASFRLNPSTAYSSLRYGVCYGTDSEPTTDQSKTAEGSNRDGQGNFSVTLRGLLGSTTYYYRPYIILDGFVYYGAVGSFTTLADNVVETGDCDPETRIVTSRLTLGGGAYSTLVLGVCYGHEDNPTVETARKATTNEIDEEGLYRLAISGTWGMVYYRAYVLIDGVPHYGAVKQISFPEPPEPETKTFTVNGVSFTMVCVAGGTFSMGSSDSEAWEWEQPVHSVTLSDYLIGETEVTQSLWLAVMGSNPSYFQGDDLPVENVSWDDCREFIGKLNVLTGASFRLPTEAEWEFAARGGNKSVGCKYSGSDTIGEVAWYDGNSSNKTHAVKSKRPNELGLYDMSGNVWEWCQDWYGGYGSGSQTNPTGPSSGSSRVSRGGSWFRDAGCCRVSDRDNYSPGRRRFNLGLRLAL